MPKLFILTLGKCQSRSFTVACQKLGLRSQQYPDDLEKAIQTCDVIVGVELSNKYKDLSKQHPESKFLLLTRDNKDWLESYVEHCELVKKGSKQTKIKRIRIEIFGTEEFDLQLWQNVKTNLENETAKFFKNKKDRFLKINPFELNDSEKWEALINFIDPKLIHKKPENGKFPHVDGL